MKNIVLLSGKYGIPRGEIVEVIGETTWYYICIVSIEGILFDVELPKCICQEVAQCD